MLEGLGYLRFGNSKRILNRDEMENEGSTEDWRMKDWIAL